MLRRIIGVTVGVCALVSTAAPAWATMQNLKSYKQAHPDQDPKTVSCKTCHEAAVGKATNLNTYGAALQKFTGVGKAKALTVEDYQAYDKANPPEAGATAPAVAPSSSTTNQTKTP